MATIPIAGGRASGGASYNATSAATTESSGFDEKLARELTAGDVMSSGASTAPFGTQAHFNSLGLTGKDDITNMLTTETYLAGLEGEHSLQRFNGYKVDAITADNPNGAFDSGALQNIGYRFGGKENTGFDTGDKNVKGYYKTDATGKFTGIDTDDVSWKSAAPVIAMLLGPLAGVIAPGFANSIGAATGMGTAASEIAARGLIGGGVSLATGGKFGHGLIGGAVTGGLNPAISNLANSIAGQGSTMAALLAGGGRLGLSAALNGGNLSPINVVGTLVDSLGKSKGRN